MAEPGELSTPARPQAAPPHVALAGVIALLEADLEVSTAGSAPVSVSDLLIADRQIVLRAWDPAVAEILTGAFAHLLAEPASDRVPEAVIDVWRGDATEARMALAEFPIPPPRGDVADVSVRDGDRALVNLEPRSGVVNAVDRSARRGYLAIPDPDRLGWWHHAAPLRHVLHALVAGPDLGLTHAASVAIPDGPAALLAGRGGSGKSTLALAGALNGMDYLGDDYVLVAPRPTPVVHGLFAKAKVTDRTIEMLPLIEPAITDRSSGPLMAGVLKSTADVAATWPERMRVSAPLAALIAPRLPRDADDAPGLRPLAPARAVLALAPSTTFQMPGLDGDALALAAELARMLPTYELVLGGDPPADVGLVADLLERGMR